MRVPRGDDPAATIPDFAELVIGPRSARTRWLHPGYVAHAALVSRAQRGTK
jgi:hypothetical protein